MAEKYHMLRSEKEIMDRDIIISLLSSGRYATIALSGEAGPYIVTLSYGYDRERNCLYFHTAKRGRKLDIIKKQPLACATVIEDLGYRQGQCDHAYRSLVIHGRIILIEDPSEKIHALEVMIDHLEADPDPVKERFLKREDNFDRAEILRMDIEDISGRENG